MHIKMSHRVPQTVVPWLGFSWIAPRVLCDPAKRCLPLTTHHHPAEFTACWDCYCFPPLPILFQQSAWHWSSRQELVKTKNKAKPKRSDIVVLGNHHTGGSNREGLPAAAAIGQDNLVTFCARGSLPAWLRKYYQRWLDSDSRFYSSE